MSEDASLQLRRYHTLSYLFKFHEFCAFGSFFLFRCKGARENSQHSRILVARALTLVLLMGGPNFGHGPE